jgi:5-methylthioribose kinase
MSTGLVGAVKKAALDAIENAKMCDLRYGKVVNTSPLKVQVTNQFTIPSSLLVVPEHLTNHEVRVTLDNVTKTMTVLGELKVGDKVALLRKQGGQSYFILDRI